MSRLFAWFDRFFERGLRGVAHRHGRRSLVARLGGRPVAEINARLANDDGRGHLRLVVADGLRIA